VLGDYLNEQTVKTSVSTGTEIARPFLPAKDFDLSKRFYEALGFAKVLDADVAIFRIGRSSFILQQHFQKECVENLMMQLMVDDLDAWWTHIASLDLPQRFGVPAPKAPALQPWGLRIAYVVDPSGVLWHIAQRRPSVKHDE
jgi:catechol 2,3-dioxygenase-like lactoylglutathione lyase family enzyme